LDSTVGFEALETLGAAGSGGGGPKVQEDLRVLAETLADNPVFDAGCSLKPSRKKKVLPIVMLLRMVQQKAHWRSTAEDANF
jgi:hypothetical protein